MMVFNSLVKKTNRDLKDQRDFLKTQDESMHELQKGGDEPES